MVLSALGLYLPYIAIHMAVFERLIPTTRDKCASRYLLDLADPFGYLEYMGVLAGKGVVSGRGDILGLFENATLVDLVFFCWEVRHWS